MLKKFACFFFLFATITAAQTTNVTATVTDSDGTLWSNGSVTVQFVPNSAQPNSSIYNINGAPLSPSVLNQGPVTLDGTGSFSLSVYDNSKITPVGSQWQFTVCPLAQSKCGITTTPISGVSQSISTLVDANILAPRFNAIAGAYGYANVEAILTYPVGGTYWSVTNQTQMYWNGTTWVAGALPGGISCVGTGSSQVCTFPGTVVAGSLTASTPILPASGGTGATTQQGAATNIVDGNAINPSSIGQTGTPGTANFSVLNASVNGWVNVKAYPYLAVGNGTTDDTSAIQSAINSVCSLSSTPTKYGGTVFFPAGNYKTTSTLYIGWGCHLKGSGAVGFPYFGSPSSLSIITPIFSNPNSWVFDTAVYNGSTPLAYNDFTSVSYGYIYQTSIEDFNINVPNQTSTPIFGGIRFAFNPGSLIRNVSINGAGLGIAVGLDYSFETVLDNVHAISNYYGLLVENNSNKATVIGSAFDAVFQPSLLSIPTAVINSVFGLNFSTYLSNVGLDASHYSSQKGIVLWSNENGGTYDIEAQNWPDMLFLGAFTYGMHFSSPYTEGSSTSPGKVNYLYTGSYASAMIDSSWAYQVGTLIDSGYDDRVSMWANGTISVSNLFQNVSQQSFAGGDHTAINIFDYAGTMPGSIPARVNVTNGPNGQNYLQSIKFNNGNQTTLSQYYEGIWTPVFTGLTVVNGTGGVTYSGHYKIVGNVLFYDLTITVSGTATTASTVGTTYFTLPSVPSRSNSGLTMSTVSLSASGVGVNSSTGNGFPPSWSAVNSNILITGSYQLN